MKMYYVKCIMKILNGRDFLTRKISEILQTLFEVFRVYVEQSCAERLWTKNGNEIFNAPRSFTECLPPGFPLVGELFCGYGTAARGYAATLSRNQLPTTRTLPVGNVEGGRGNIWRSAKIIAFDVPMKGMTEYTTPTECTTSKFVQKILRFFPVETKVCETHLFLA